MGKRAWKYLSDYGFEIAFVAVITVVAGAAGASVPTLLFFQRVCG